ncbi:MAG: sulfatase-like hydrolase/transferase [Rhodobiaceae bacterium]|nr:sulfatase-like hydrolase/transferase [Rhodobiaceae bacterium]
MGETAPQYATGGASGFCSKMNLSKASSLLFSATRAAAFAATIYAGMLASCLVLLPGHRAFIVDPAFLAYLGLVAMACASTVLALNALGSLSMAILVAAFWTLYGALDLTFLLYFNKPWPWLYQYLSVPRVSIAAVPHYANFVSGYAQPRFLAASLGCILFSLALAKWLLFARSGHKRTELLVLGAALAAGFLVRIPAARSIPAIIAPIMAVNPHIPVQKLKAAKRAGVVLDGAGPKSLPSTIILVINESTGAFFPSSLGPQMPLASRIAALAGDPRNWNIFINAVTNSSASDISLPSILTGVGGHEGFDKLHTMPFVFDLAKARGFTTAFFTSTILDWANFDRFFSSAAIDFSHTAADSGLPLANDLSIDDHFVARKMADFITTRKEGPLFLVWYPNALHTPYQAESEIGIPAALTNRRARALYILESAYEVLFDALKAAGRYDDALILVTGDHGEDPDSPLARVDNYSEPVLRPIFMAKESTALSLRQRHALAANRTALVANADIAPTIADLLKARPPRSIAYGGHSLFGAIPPDRLSIAVSTNEWRSWPTSALSLARGRERFTCNSYQFCVYRDLASNSLENERTARPGSPWSAYFGEAGKYPIVRQIVSEIYHGGYHNGWALGRNGTTAIDKAYLSSDLPDFRTYRAGHFAVAEQGHDPSFVFTGPHWRLAPGAYEVAMDVSVKSSPQSAGQACAFEVHDGHQVIGEHPISARSDVSRQRVVIAFDVGDRRPGPYDFRLRCSGRATTIVDALTLSRTR